jgi:hypothetical protein
MTSRGARLAALIIAILLGHFLYLRARSAWVNYWLLKDAHQGIATVTEELWSGHKVVGYNYIVNQKDYTGRSRRNRQDKKYGNVQVGETSVVYFSASHPWLSLLYMPQAVLEGLPVILLVLALETFAVITIVNPNSRWAFSFIQKAQPHGV